MDTNRFQVDKIMTKILTDLIYLRPRKELAKSVVKPLAKVLKREKIVYQLRRKVGCWSASARAKVELH